MCKPLPALLFSLVLLATLYTGYFPGPIKASPNLIEVSVATLWAVDDGSVVLLKENQGERFLPISIGDPETRAIVLGLQRRRRPDDAPRRDRPLTHNLLLDVVQRLGARVDHIAVSDLRSNVYYADIYLKLSGGKEIKIDARPSDAIALAVTTGKPVPIYVTRDLMLRSGRTVPHLFERDADEKKKALRL